MKSKNALTTIAIISLIGILFSGYLTISELTANTCPIGGCQQVAGLPTCMYGLIMYLAVFIIAMLGKKQKIE